MIQKNRFRVFFFLGIYLMSVGISLTIAVGPAFISFLAGGVAFMAFSVTNRDKWTKSSKRTLNFYSLFSYS
jgi:hypothetical protein